jgi:hypothetical protein
MKNGMVPGGPGKSPVSYFAHHRQLLVVQDRLTQGRCSGACQRPLPIQNRWLEASAFGRTVPRVISAAPAWSGSWGRPVPGAERVCGGAKT